jgi:four helix bundle protein
MPFKFEGLEVWDEALEYLDVIYGITESLPQSEDFNLRSQLIRAATSVALNIAEGSTGQTDVEQARFIGISIRSLVETVACQQIIRRRGYLKDAGPLDKAYDQANLIARRLHYFRRALDSEQRWLREASGSYSTEQEW